MADQLLSQADVDALVASLSKNDTPKAAPVAAKPVTPAPVAAKPPTAPAPVVAAPKPSAFSSTASRPAPANFGNMTVVSNTKPGAPVNTASRSGSAPVSSEAGNETISALNTKVAELTKQLNNLGAALKRMEMLEKKVSEMEAKAAKNNPATADLKIQQLTDEMRKIVVNLKGTPGYGAKNTFTCEKCDDQGHVAVQYRCTKCGKERWYGWWPEKKK
jgi:hypothetical protein